MKYTNLLTLFTLLLLIGFSSCKKEEITEIKDPVIEELKPTITSSNQLVFNVENNNSGDGLDLDCFSIDFPFGLNADGTVTEINNEEEFFAVLEEEPELVDFVYPINVTYDDGETATANDGEELGELFASCIPDTGWSGNDGFPAFLICEINSCYQLVYPVGLNDGNGTDYTANSEEEFIELIVENPELYFDFPLNLTDVDGETVTANNDEELFGLVASCDDNYNPGPDSTDYGVGTIACFEIGYPVSVLDVDGNETTIANEDEFANAMLNGTIVSFVYPISLIDEDGNTVVVDSEEGLFSAILDCGGFVNITPIGAHISMSSLYGGTCYDLVYPMTGTDPFTSETVTINNDSEAMASLDGATGGYGLDFPLSVVEISSGNTVVFDSIADYFVFISDCQ